MSSNEIQLTNVQGCMIEADWLELGMIPWNLDGALERPLDFVRDEVKVCVVNI